MAEFTDRRTTERVSLEIPLELVTLPITIAEGSQSSHTKNISCSGLYCKLNQYIPPFTHVEVNLFLPQEQSSFRKISFQGIVVRIEPTEEGDKGKEYHVAIFVPSGINLENTPLDSLFKGSQQTQYED
jgi:hypothetical protein